MSQENPWWSSLSEAEWPENPLSVGGWVGGGCWCQARFHGTKNRGANVREQKICIPGQAERSNIPPSFFFLGPCCIACLILVPQPGIKPVPPALGEWSLNHWTTKQSPFPHLFVLLRPSMDGVMPICMGESGLTGPLIQMLISDRNTLLDTPRNGF